MNAPLRHLLRFTASVAVLLAGAVHAQMIPWFSEYNSWRFEDTKWFSTYGYAPVSFSGLVYTNAGAGHSVLIDSPDPAWLQYHTMEDDGHTNLCVDSGTVLFWFAPAWSGTNAGGTGPGEFGRLFEVGAYTTNASYGWWSLFVDPEGANIYFSAQTNGLTVDYLSAPITWTNNTWHHIALAYSSSNTTLYLDGNPVTNGPAMTCCPGANALANGFFVGSDRDGLNQAHGAFDDLSIYDGPLDAATIGGMAAIYSIIYDAPIVSEALSSAESSSPGLPTLNAISGAGFLQLIGPAGSCFNGSEVWITNAVSLQAANQTATFTFSIEGGWDNAAYDVFANAVLGPTTSTNYQWAWLGQGYHCNTYQLTDLPLASAFLRLGTPLDSDFDGLTDAYERLVSATDPSRPDSALDGVSDLYKLMHGLQPTAPLSIPSLDSISLSICPVL